MEKNIMADITLFFNQRYKNGKVSLRNSQEKRAAKRKTENLRRGENVLRPMKAETMRIV